MKESSYLKNRMILSDHYDNYRLPPYLLNRIINKDSYILDIGCGYGQMLSALRILGFNKLYGVDIDEGCVSVCKKNNLDVKHIKSIESYCSQETSRFNCIIISHVLEHIEKEQIIDSLRAVRNLLEDDGDLYIMVPNAQSNTHCYWAYEDFTHTTLFTAGSLAYVLKSAGFQSIEWLDPDCTEGIARHKAIIKRLFLKIYILNARFWNNVTSSYWHNPSDKIFSYELKARAKKPS